MALESLYLLEHIRVIPCRSGVHTSEILQNLFLKALFFMHWFSMMYIPKNIGDILGKEKKVTKLYV